VSSLWSRGGLTRRQLVHRVWREMVDDEIFGRSAELAFYFLFSLFPLLLSLTALLGYAVEASSALRGELFAYLERVIPNQAALEVVRDTLQEIVDRRGNKLSLGLLLSLWVASQGIAAVGRVLDTAYEVRRRRPIWKEQVVAVALTIACLLLIFTALGLIFYGSEVVQFLAERAFSSLFTSAWALLQWPLGLFFVLLAFDLIYNFSPAHSPGRHFHWFTPGAVTGVGVWLAASFGFQLYVTRFDLYTWAYGSLGAVIVLMAWFYLAGFAILLGAELNSEVLKARGEAPAEDG
jgi:membrane protein